MRSADPADTWDPYTHCYGLDAMSGRDADRFPAVIEADGVPYWPALEDGTPRPTVEPLTVTYYERAEPGQRRYRRAV